MRTVQPNWKAFALSFRIRISAIEDLVHFRCMFRKSAGILVDVWFFVLLTTIGDFNGEEMFEQR